MRVYPNNGKGIIDRDNYLQLSVSCPIPRPSGRCKGEEGWTGDDHWYNADQIITGGDINNDQTADLLVKQGKQLWVYYGNRSAELDKVRPHPVLVGETDWDKFTVVVPGDLNGDTLPDLLLRENASGDLFRSYGTGRPHRHTRFGDLGQLHQPREDRHRHPAAEPLPRHRLLRRPRRRRQR